MLYNGRLLVFITDALCIDATAGCHFYRSSGLVGWLRGWLTRDWSTWLTRRIGAMLTRWMAAVLA